MTQTWLQKFDPSSSEKQRTTTVHSQGPNPDLYGIWLKALTGYQPRIHVCACVHTQWTFPYITLWTFIPRWPFGYKLPIEGSGERIRLPFAYSHIWNHKAINLWSHGHTMHEVVMSWKQERNGKRIPGGFQIGLFLLKAKVGNKRGQLVKFSITSFKWLPLAVHCSCSVWEFPVRTLNNTHFVPPLPPHTVSESATVRLQFLPHARVNTCTHTGHSILGCKHLTTWPTQFLHYIWVFIWSSAMSVPLHKGYRVRKRKVGIVPPLTSE